MTPLLIWHLLALRRGRGDRAPLAHLTDPKLSMPPHVGAGFRVGGREAQPVDPEDYLALWRAVQLQPQWGGQSALIREVGSVAVGRVQRRFRTQPWRTSELEMNSTSKRPRRSSWVKKGKRIF